MTPGRVRGSGAGARLRFAALFVGLSLLAFLLGRRVVQPARITHALSGRVIPGLATDAAWMDRRDRRDTEAPDQALALLAIEPGMHVADIGAGTGYLTVGLSALVGERGRVYATEIQTDLLRRLQARIRAADLTNVEVIAGADDDARLPAHSLDLALMVDVYHELQQPQAMLRSVGRALRSNGRLVVIEYRLEDPRLMIAGTHRMSVNGVRKEVEPEGFILTRQIEDLPRQHLLIFRKTGEP